MKNVKMSPFIKEINLASSPLKRELLKFTVTLTNFTLFMYYPSTLDYSMVLEQSSIFVVIIEERYTTQF